MRRHSDLAHARAAHHDVRKVHRHLLTDSENDLRLDITGVADGGTQLGKGIAALVRQIRRERVRTVFLENMTDPRVTQMLARETGASVSGPLYSYALSKPDGPAADYLTMLRYNTTWFVRAMRPAS